MDTMTSDKTTTRRRYSADFKAQVLGDCDAPGASVAKVAMSHGINTNVVHGWRKLAREAGCASAVSSHEFVPVALSAAPMQSVAERGIEV
ncbi:transposase IS3/IS911 family protein, partial [sediment metagenome]